MDFADDERLRDVLSSLHVSPEDLLGRGGEASVYALGEHRVVRVLREGQDDETIRRRQVLVDELRSEGAPFELPDVIDVGQVNGRWFAIERRCNGVPLMDQLVALDRHERDLLVERHLETAALLGALHLEPRGWYGELLAEDPVRSPTWRGYLRERAATSLRQSTPPFRGVSAAELADALPETTACAFVHLDAFAGNMLATGTTVTAVLDIGPTSVAGDRRLDPLAVAVYLCTPQITPVTTSRDAEVTMSWLRSADLAEWFAPARRWLAAFWSFAVDDRRLHEWCRSVLLDTQP